MKLEENGAGFEVDEILNDLAQGHESVHTNHNLNMIDLNGVEIDEIIKHTKRGVRWNDDNNDVVNIPPENDDSFEEDVRDVDASTSARRPWTWTALVVVWSLLAFAALAGVGYGVGYAISRSSPSSEATVSSSMMEAVEAEISSYSPTYMPVAALRTVEQIVSNDVEPGSLYGLDGDVRRARNRRRTGGLRPDPSED
jgi:hypothetical protein